MSDILRQVDDELRKEKFSNFWKKYKIILISFVLIIVLFVSAIQFYQYKDNENKKIFVEKYFDSFDDVNLESRIKNLKELNATNIFTNQLTNLQIANTYFKNGNSELGLEYLEEVFSKNEKNLLSNLALYKYLMFQLDTISENEMLELIEKQSSIDLDFSFLFKELIAIKFLIDGKVNESKTEFELILSDMDIPSGVRVRAEKYLNTIE